MSFQKWSPSRNVSVQCYLSEPGEKEALRVLKKQLRHQKRITSDDVRLAVRAVASQGGAVSIPIDFPPSHWVLEFKRVHGFMQLNSFAFNTTTASTGDKAVRTPERLEMAKLRPVAAPVEPGPNSERTTSASNNSSSNTSSSNNVSIQDERSSSSSTGVVQVAGRNDNNSDDGKEKRPSKETLLPMLSKTAVAYADSRPSFTNEAQRQTQLQHIFSQRHQQQLQQQQRRAKIVDERRRSVVWPRESARGTEETRPGASRISWSNEISTNAGWGDLRPSGNNDVGPNGGRDISSMLPQIQHVVINNGSSMDEIQDSASNTSSSSKDKRSYKLSHTVPAETWEKAIAAVEQQGMSLRTAAKMYGVHFAALHRRVKKRTQGGQANSNDAYFDPNDEAGIMRVVVAHAELGVLMTFDELMRLVEAVALRKLPDISVDSARKLLTRFESRNAQSIRHIVDDWPPPQPSVNAHSSAKPYLEHPGFSFAPTSTTTGGAATATAVAAATPTTLFVPPIRLAPTVVNFRNDSKSPAVRLIDTMRTMDIETTPSLSPSNHVGCVVTHPETTRLHPSREVCIEEGVDCRK